VPVVDDPAWAFPILPASPSEGWSDAALALDGNPKTGARGPATRSDWTKYITFGAPVEGFLCDGIRFRSSFTPPSVIAAPGGRGNEPYVVKATWQIDIRTAAGWKQVYEGALPQLQWADVSFGQEAVSEIRIRARGDGRNTLDPILFEVNLHDASM